MTDKVVSLPPQPGPPNVKGPSRAGFAVIVDGRKIPNMHMLEEGDEICFVLDSRLAFPFPRELAHQAAAFAANAMAIGAGYAFLGAEAKEHPFAPQCFAIDLAPDGEQPS